MEKGDPQKSKLFQKKLSKDNLLQLQDSNIKRKDSKVDFSFLKKNLKLRKSQDKIDKVVRYNT